MNKNDEYEWNTYIYTTGGNTMDTWEYDTWVYEKPRGVGNVDKSTTNVNGGVTWRSGT